ncbi:MAG: hypothetical protein HFI09_00605 [Bacilli bacterium]|nr:hypothetical protein [Bacilli bacterium]
MKNEVNLIIEYKNEKNDETFPLVFLTNDLDLMDLETLSYKSEREFIAKNKEKIEKKLCLLPRSLDGFQINRIFIEKNEEQLKPLFQNFMGIDSRYHTYNLPLALVIKCYLRQKSIFLLYELDKNAQIIPGYLSIFHKCPKNVLEALELKKINEDIVDNIWLSIKDNPALLRFLIRNLDYDKMIQAFDKIIIAQTKEECPKRSKKSNQN